jgi:5-methylcytosine-specific restriction endonuclease McrA
MAEILSTYWQKYLNKQNGVKKKPKTKARKKTPKVTSNEKELTPKQKYKAFLKTDYWKAVRVKVFLRDKKTCQKCGSKKKIEAHHLTYKHHRNEMKHLEDLITLCRDCHEKEHKLEIMIKKWKDQT